MNLCAKDDLAPYLKKFPLVRQMTQPHMCVDENGDICSNGMSNIYAASRMVPKMSIHDTIEYVIKNYADGHPEFVYMFSISGDPIPNNPNKIWVRFSAHVPYNSIVGFIGDYQI